MNRIFHIFAGLCTCMALAQPGIALAQEDRGTRWGLGIGGIAQDLGYKVREQDVPRESLYTVDEMFFTGTASEVTPIRSVDRIPVGAGARGPVTEAIQKRFLDTVRGRVEDTRGWLTRV